MYLIWSQIRKPRIAGYSKFKRNTTKVLIAEKVETKFQ